MTKIMNIDMFDDKRDYIIARLRAKIEEFKKYDQRRKDYYKAVIEENRRMRDELNRGKDTLAEEDKPQSKKDELIKQLKAQVSALNTKLTNYGLTMDGVDDKEIQRMKEENRLYAMSKQIQTLSEEVHRLRETNSMLICQLNSKRENNR